MNEEELKEYQKKYRDEHKEKNREYQKQYYKRKKKQLKEIGDEKMVYNRLISKYKKLIYVLMEPKVNNDEDDEDNEEYKREDVINKIMDSITKTEQKYEKYFKNLHKFTLKDMKIISKL